MTQIGNTCTSDYLTCMDNLNRNNQHPSRYTLAMKGRPDYIAILIMSYIQHIHILHSAKFIDWLLTFNGHFLLPKQYSLQSNVEHTIPQKLINVVVNELQQYIKEKQEIVIIELHCTGWINVKMGGGYDYISQVKIFLIYQAIFHDWLENTFREKIKVHENHQWQ